MSSDRVEITLQLLLQAAVDGQCWISGDHRVGEDTAASLLGWSRDGLRNARSEGRGPPHFRIGGGGNKISYSLRDLAEWIESQRENNFA